MSTPLPSSQTAGDLCLSDPEAEAQRKRGLAYVRAALGAGIVMGVGVLVFGLSFRPTTATAPAVVPIGGGVYMIAICLAGFAWFGRLPGRTIVSLRPTDNGIQVRLRNGTPLSVDWSSPKMAFDLSKFPQSARNPTTSYWLGWRMDRAVVGCRLSEAGGSHLISAAQAHGLRVTEKTFGKEPNVQTIFSVRAAGARK